MSASHSPTGADGGELRALVAQLVAVLPALGALVEMAAQRAAAQRGTADSAQLAADVGAVGLARGARGHERLAGLEDERLDLGARDLEHAGNLVVRVGAELGHDERGALIVGQAADVEHEIAQILAALHERVGLLARAVLEVGDRDLAAPAQDRVATVARDDIEPGPQIDVLIAGQDARVGGQERVLDGVLGLVAIAEEVAAEAEDGGAIARVHGLEGRAVPGLG